MKYLIITHIFQIFTSLPVRGAWIEMLINCSIYVVDFVAPRAGSVD